MKKQKEFSKEFFQKAWGEGGYYEDFSYGVGIHKVEEVCITPFIDKRKTALEIGCGGGSFTKLLIGKFSFLTALDVINKPTQLDKYADFAYIELPSKSYDCEGVAHNSINFVFCYNVFCHLTNDALKKYLESINKIIIVGGDFIFMLSYYPNIKKYFRKRSFRLGDILPTGHYYQDERTLGLIIGDGWEIVNDNMLPEHRDRVIHLRKI